MTRQKLRVRLGLFVIISHLTCNLIVVFLFFARGFLFDEMTTALAIMGPMTIGHATTTVRWILANDDSREDLSRPISGAQAFVSFLLPSVFALLLMSACAAQAFHLGFSSFEQYKIFLGVIEGAFGAFYGMVLGRWFTHDDE